MKQLGAAITLYHRYGDLLDLLVGGETLATGYAFPPAADGFFDVRLSRIYDTAVRGAAERAVHRVPPPPRRRFVATFSVHILKPPADLAIRDTYHIWCAQ